MADQLALAFDYGVLDPITRATVEGCRDEIRRREKRAAEDIIEIGRQLVRARDAMPGRFESWLSSEFAWERTTAYRFMRVAESFGGRVANCYISASALYALASGEVPEEIRDQFIAQAESGETVRHKDVKAAIEEARAEREPPPLFAVVDLETGEIVPPERIERRDSSIRADYAELLEYADDDPEGSERDRLHRQLLLGLKALAKLAMLSPAHIAALPQEEVRIEVGAVLPQARRWMDEVERVLAPELGLRRVR